MRLGPLAVGTIAGACLATSAAAQVAPAADAQREFGGSLSLRGAYDSNFARSTDATASQRGLSQEEYSLTPTLDLRLVQPLGRQILYFDASAGYDFYRENDQLNRGRGNIVGGYLTNLGPCGLNAAGSFSAAQADLALIDSPGIKNLVQSTTVSAGATCTRGRGLVVGASVQRTETENSATIQKEADSTTDALSVQLGYGDERRGQVSLVYGYSESDFPNRVFVPGQSGDGFFTQSLSVSVRRQFGARLTARASAGRTTVKREFAPPGIDPKFTSTNYSAGIDYRLGSRLNLTLTADRAVVPSARAGKLYDISTSGEIAASYQLGSRFTVSVAHGIEDVDSNADTSLGRPVITNSRVNSTLGSIAFRQSERVSILLDVRYDDRTTNLPEFNYTATRVGLAVEVGF